MEEALEESLEEALEAALEEALEEPLEEASHSLPLEHEKGSSRCLNQREAR